MDYIEEIQLLKSLAEDFHVERKIIGFFMVVLISAVVGFILKSRFKLKSHLIILIIITSVCCCGIVFLLAEIQKVDRIDDQIESLVYEMINQEGSFVKVVVSDVVNTTKLDSEYCRELKKNEDCFLVEFVSKSEINYAFIGLNETRKFPNQEIVFKLLDLTKKEKTAFSDTKKASLPIYIHGDELSNYPLTVFSTEHWAFAELAE